MPEHILNKPESDAGGVREDEAPRPIGAEILSAIDFPYPSSRSCAITTRTGRHRVPDGLRGIDIPIGARICRLSIATTRDVRPPYARR